MSGGPDRWWVAVVTVAGLVVVVTLAVGILTMPASVPGTVPAVSQSADVGLGAIAEAALDSLGLDGGAVLRLRAELVAAFERRREELPDEAAVSVDDSLQILDRNIVELSAALERDPSNRELARLLASAYRRQVEMLRRVEQLTPRRAPEAPAHAPDDVGPAVPLPTAPPSP